MNTNEATYCPEDDKLRLYIGRVPREEYEALRKEGWTSTPKQNCDFVATWNVKREETALRYADFIGDEDQSPAERSADRAERFGGYLDKRLEEAKGWAKAFESKDSVHGYQSADKANREVRKHERLGIMAGTQWDKAEYWQSRTAGVISHALYILKPSVRMGRIKKIETEIRNFERYTGYEKHINHLKLRLAYETQMINEQGGRATDSEYMVGGLIGKYRIFKVARSTATKKITSLTLVAPKIVGASAWEMRSNIEGTEYSLRRYNIERAQSVDYVPPTNEDIKFIENLKKDMAKVSPKKPPLINPTKEDAQRLQNIWNTERAENNKRYMAVDLPPEIIECTQAYATANSSGSYAPIDTVFIGENGLPTYRQYHGNTEEGAILKIRRMRRTGSIVVITDKPQKSLPEFEAVVYA